MSDHYVQVKEELEQKKSPGEGGEKDAVAEEETVPIPLAASVSPATASLRGRGDVAKTSVTGRQRSKSRSTQGAPDRNIGNKRDSDGGHAAEIAREKMPGTLLQVKGTGKALQGRAETNGVAAPGHQEGDRGKEDGNKVARKRRAVTVDTSKAKTSLEALKVSIRQLKWKEFPLGRRVACDIYWHGVSFHDNENIISGQVNKFPGMIEMLRKINLSRAVRTMQELFPEEYSFYPRSWILPEEFPLFTTQIRLAKDSDSALNPTFIVKPDGGSQGDGIYLIRDPRDLRITASPHGKHVIVQEYIQKPLLIDKLKFDIRLYVLLRSLEPLEIYIAKEGLSRFCTEPYQEPNQKNLNHVFMHLTNYSLNVHSGNFIHSHSNSTGSKRTFSSILYRLASKGVDIKKVWSDIISLVIKTVIALVPELKVYYQADIPPGKPGPTCFQILGFDILLMKNLKPVLLEVNANPSMRIEHEQEVSPGVFEYVPSPVDEEVKVGVIRDTLRLVDPAQKKTSHLPSLLPGEGGGELQKDVPEAESPKRPGVESGLPSLCLKQVFPKYTKQFNYLRLVERMAALFVRFLGVKGTMRLGPTGFRTFIRNCKLTNSSLSMAAIDILYIDITRRWGGTVSESREAGMSLPAFAEAFFYLAQRRFKAQPLREQVQALLELCEAQLKGKTSRERRAPPYAPPPPGPPTAIHRAPDSQTTQALQPALSTTVET
ncbi:tubulin polyglutamylase TTLL11 isoform X1 [Paramormyrops kingsleyae]|uniref:Tubulin tyrosine ligase-like family, member 11 n=1 Tax=Paramormyrops kingsleyae TaxID=1676925 RepID=A0A3B3QVZ0_9TELE|nr:tubulin polyglutamylase TTLL11 isoform X1 [Paramormyrops kingsleyae]